MSNLKNQQFFNRTFGSQKSCLTMRARGRLEPWRSGARMGDSRSGLLLRPIAPLNWVYSVSGVSLVPPAAGPCPEGVYPLGGRCPFSHSGAFGRMLSPTGTMSRAIGQLTLDTIRKKEIKWEKRKIQTTCARYCCFFWELWGYSYYSMVT